MKEYIVRYETEQIENSEFFYGGKVECELIRCKDCQYWMKNPYRESSVFGLCFKHKDIAIATDETDWCSWAERRTE